MTGRQAERIQAAIARLGDVAIDPTLWPVIMEDISRAIGATGAALLQADVRTPDVPRTPGVDDLFKAYFGGDWHLRDIRARGAPLLMSGVKRVVTDQDVVSQDEMRDGSYYNELLRPFRMRWFAAVGFQAGPAPWALSIHRDARAGAFDSSEQRLLEQLAPRLTDAATLSATVGRAVLSGIGNALDLCGQPTLALDRTGSVLHANASADRLFDHEIRVSRRKLIVQDQKARGDLDELMAWLRTGGEFATVPGQAILVRKKVGPSVVLRVLPVPPAARGPFLGARVLLTLSVLRTPTGTDPRLLIQTFGLTPAEAKLAAAIADGVTLAEAGERSGVALSTVRNHLKVVFVKTGTHRQSDLAALLSVLRVPHE